VVVPATATAAGAAGGKESWYEATGCDLEAVLVSLPNQHETPARIMNTEQAASQRGGE
jgi:hypothetical protein